MAKTFHPVFEEVVNSCFSLFVCEQSHFPLENHKCGNMIFPLLSDAFDLFFINGFPHMHK